MVVSRLRREGRQQYRQAAGAVAEASIAVSFIRLVLVRWTRHHATTDSTLAVFCGRGCMDSGCILTRKPKRKLPTLRAAAPDEHQPGCFALEEEKGGRWMGTGVPVIKETRPTL